MNTASPTRWFQGSSLGSAKNGKFDKKHLCAFCSVPLGDFFSPSPPREEKGLGDEEVEAGYEIESPRGIRQALTPRRYVG